VVILSAHLREVELVAVVVGPAAEVGPPTPDSLGRLESLDDVLAGDDGRRIRRGDLQAMMPVEFP